MRCPGTWLFGKEEEPHEVGGGAVSVVEQSACKAGAIITNMDPDMRSQRIKEENKRSGRRFLKRC